MSENIHDFNMRVRSEQSRESKQREAEYASNSADAHTRLTHMQLERDAALNALEIAKTVIKSALERDGCRCDTSVCDWCKTDGWVYISPDTARRLRLCL